MNTINGNFIEKSIPNIKNATIALNIGGVDATMTVEKFAAAIVPAPTVTYKSYVALITQLGSNPLVVTVLENALRGTVVWTKDSNNNGTYIATLSSAFTENKTFLLVSSSQGVSSNNVDIAFFYNDSNTVILQAGQYGTPTNGLLVGTGVEIRVYN